MTPRCPKMVFRLRYELLRASLEDMIGHLAAKGLHEYFLIGVSPQMRHDSGQPPEPEGRLPQDGLETSE